MTFIETIAPREAAGDVREMYLRQQRAYGFVPNYAKVFCHRPEIMRLWAELQKGIRRHVDPRRFELVTLAAAHALGNTYCALAHAKALTKFLPLSDVCAIARDPRGAGLTPAEGEIVELARKVALDAGAVTRDDVDRLKRHGLTDAEIFDVVAIAAARAFFTKVFDALGAEPDSAWLRAEPELLGAMVVGRAIESAPTERCDDDEHGSDAPETSGRTSIPPRRPRCGESVISASSRR